MKVGLGYLFVCLFETGSHRPSHPQTYYVTDNGLELPNVQITDVHRYTHQASNTRVFKTLLNL